MNISEVWNNYFALDSPYSFDKALLDLGEVFSEQGAWEEPSDDYKEFESQSVLKHRQVVSVAKLPKNPVSSTIDNKRNSYLLQFSDTALAIQDTNDGSGFMYADAI